MKKFYEQAKDVHVRGTMFYASNKLMYTDPDCEVKATKEEVIDAFVKGTIIIAVPPNNICKPINLVIEEKYVSILCEFHTYGSDTRQSIQLVAGTPPEV